MVGETTGADVREKALEQEVGNHPGQGQYERRQEGQQGLRIGSEPARRRDSLALSHAYSSSFCLTAAAGAA